MLISEFQVTEDVIEGFQFVEIEPYTRYNNQHVRRFNIQQWCPIIKRWYRVLMPGTWHQNFESEDETPVNDDTCVIKPAILKAMENPPKAVVVLPEKHGTQYFSANSTEEIGMAALHIVKERYDQGYYSLIQQPVQPNYNAEDYPDSPQFVAFVKQEQEIYERDLRQYREEKEFMRVLEHTLVENHYGGAVGLLKTRNGYEYEGFVIEQLILVE